MSELESDFAPNEPFEEPQIAPPARKPPLKDHIFRLGLGLIAASGCLFLWLDRASSSFSDFPMGILAPFICVFIYTIALWGEGRLRWWFFGSRRPDWPTTLLLLVLWLISCYSLNREITVFNRSTDWLTAYLLLGSAASISYAWRDQMAVEWRRFLMFLLAAFAVLMGYLTVILLPTTFVGLIVVWFFGLSLHAWVPLVFLVYLILILRAEMTERPSARWAIWSGLALPLLIAIGFVGMYGWRTAELRRTYMGTQLSEKDALPNWVRVAQKLPADRWTERLLKGEEFFQTPRVSDPLFGFMGNGGNGPRLHDPLVFLAKGLIPPVQISSDDRRKILRSIYGGRHDMQERLWDGFDLTIPSLATRVEIDAPGRTSYTEKTMLIHNSASWGSSQQEAVFTLHLPEGGCVTSLSLWVNGEERPGWLTAKSKADTAWKTIVGVQRRDPAIVTWQEGSTVVLRVFPCTPAEMRKVKIGITAPLRAAGNDLFYDNIAIDGPPPKSCRERVELFLEKAVPTLMPGFFEQKADETGQNHPFFEGSMRGEWSVAVRSEPTGEAKFSFQNQSFQLEPLGQTATEKFSPTAIYLDLNESWTRDEFARMLAISKKKNWPLRVWSGGERLLEIRLEIEGWGFFEEMSDLHFSMFPFQKIPDPATALVITKTGRPTPNFTDLRGSRFANEIEKWTTLIPPGGLRPIRCFSISEKGLSSWLATLAELRIFQIVRGSADDLLKLMDAEIFPQLIENESVAIIAASNSKITVLPDTTAKTTTGHHHLARLFAYNSILRKIGPRLFQNNYEPAPLVEQAQNAFVVTPVSSLLVLETDADYGRFGITPPPSWSLANAALAKQRSDQKEVPLPDAEALLKAANHSSGAVPEPGEWALILLAGLFMAWLWRRHFWQKG